MVAVLRWQIEDIAREDSWDVGLQAEKEVPLLKIRDGDYLATTCIYNSDKREIVTLGGRSSHDEICLGFLAGEFQCYEQKETSTVQLA